ncbi:hypothetical protein [Reichenbachiella ulvae]|uniref:Uncharacterized protein n=1 Tax=Reichenbachiella ulvae TaxID=2980104 RepID=A0ABT3CWC5_9BACT|nr:hypothetical protein [Reichenbachiella ulvae]MCV9387819.1 hypothetical protein [Reichenbachiella ulvae]
MNVIWYNTDSKSYHYGCSEEFVKAVSKSGNPSALKIVMKFNNASNRLVQKVLNQLNLVNQKMEKSVEIF